MPLASLVRARVSIHFIKPVAKVRDRDAFAPLRITPLMPNFGARIEGVDLSADQPAEVKAQLRQAWLRFGVIFFRGQTRLTPERQLELATIFGTPDAGSHMVE